MIEGTAARFQPRSGSNLTPAFVARWRAASGPLLLEYWPPTLIFPTPMLIMDEPTARLAPHERERLFDIMRRLAASGVGIIYISHFLEEVEQTADRITMLHDGNVVASYDAGERTIDELTRLHLF